MASKNFWENVYEKPISEIPWEIEGAPRELVFALENKVVAPCKCLDIACGSGNYSIFLARRGFGVTAFDISQTALKIARKKARAARVKIKFVRADARELLQKFDGEKFGLIFDYSLLHHISDLDFSAYANQFSNLLENNGKLFLVCYSEKDNAQKSAIGKLGNEIFYRSKDEILEAYLPLKCVHYEQSTLGKQNHHRAHFFIFRKSY